VTNMASDGRTAKRLEDVSVNIKVKLSLLWVALMFLYLYNDVMSFFQPGNVRDLVGGEIGGIHVTQVFLLGAAILMAIPIFMVLLSVALPARWNRPANIVLGIFHAVVLVATTVVGTPWAYYALYMALEAFLIAVIVWTAWKWPTAGNGSVTR